MSAPQRNSHGRRVVEVTFDQLAFPETAWRTPGGDEDASLFERTILLTLLRWCWNPATDEMEWSDVTDLDIADAAGLRGDSKARQRRVQKAIHGRTDKAYNRVTKKQDGAPIFKPGLGHESRGIIEIEYVGPRRRLRPGPKWRDFLAFGAFGQRNGVASPPTSPAPPLSGSASPNGATAPPVEAVPDPACLKRVLGRHAEFPPRDQAERLIELLRRRGILLKPIAEGKLQPVLPVGETLNEDWSAVIRFLKPVVLSLLQPKAAPTSGAKADDAPDAKKAAPPVACKKEVIAAIARLTSQPSADDSDCEAIVQRLVSDPGFAHNDADPAKSAATYRGLALQTKDGTLPEVVMREAFDAACGAQVGKRGAYFVKEVKRLKAEYCKRE